jgi:hypothetical protein
VARLGSQTQLPSVTRVVHENPQGAGLFADRERLAHELANAVPGMAMTTIAAAVPAKTFTFLFILIDSSYMRARTIPCVVGAPSFPGIRVCAITLS